MFYEQTLYSLRRPPETGVVVVVLLLEFEPVSWESEPVQLYLLAGSPRSLPNPVCAGCH
jgi:hypothetical protein